MVKKMEKRSVTMSQTGKWNMNLILSKVKTKENRSVTMSKAGA